MMNQPAYTRDVSDPRSNTAAPMMQPYRDQESLFDEASEVNKGLNAAAIKVSEIELALFGPQPAPAECLGKPANGPPALSDMTGESVRAVRRLLERLEQIHRRIGAPQG